MTKYEEAMILGEQLAQAAHEEAMAQRPAQVEDVFVRTVAQGDAGMLVQLSNGVTTVEHCLPPGDSIVVEDMANLMFQWSMRAANGQQGYSFVE